MIFGRKSEAYRIQSIPPIERAPTPLNLDPSSVSSVLCGESSSAQSSIAPGSLSRLVDSR